MLTTPAQSRSAVADPSSHRGTRKSGAAAVGDAEALARAAAERLARGEGGAAFALADRRCRLMVPAARDFLLRAQAHKAAGRLDSAQADLAARAGARSHRFACWIPQRFPGATRPRSLRPPRASSVAPATSWRLRRKAVETLLSSGARIAHNLRREAEVVSGWIAWAGGEPFRIEMSGLETSHFELDPDPDHPLATDADFGGRSGHRGAGLRRSHIDAAPRRRDRARPSSRRSPPAPPSRARRRGAFRHARRKARLSSP